MEDFAHDEAHWLTYQQKMLENRGRHSRRKLRRWTFNPWAYSVGTVKNNLPKNVEQIPITIGRARRRRRQKVETNCSTTPLSTRRHEAMRKGLLLLRDGTYSENFVTKERINLQLCEQLVSKSVALLEQNKQMGWETDDELHSKTFTLDLCEQKKQTEQEADDEIHSKTLELGDRSNSERMELSKVVSRLYNHISMLDQENAKLHAEAELLKKEVKDLCSENQQLSQDKKTLKRQQEEVLSSLNFQISKMHEKYKSEVKINEKLSKNLNEEMEKNIQLTSQLKHIQIELEYKKKSLETQKLVTHRYKTIIAKQKNLINKIK
eukprot:g4514.t1